MSDRLGEMIYKSSNDSILPLTELICESLGRDIQLLLRKIKLLERKDICLEFVSNLYMKFYSVAQQADVRELISMYHETSLSYPRTRRLIFDSLCNLVSKCFISGQKSRGDQEENDMNLDNCQTLTSDIINSLMKFSKRQFFQLLDAILSSREFAFFEKDVILIWNAYPFLKPFIQNVYQRRLREEVSHFQYGIYFKYSAYNAVDIVSYCIQDEALLGHLEQQYSDSDYVIHGYRHNSNDLSEFQHKRIWEAALKNEVYIHINSDSYSIFAEDELIFEIPIASVSNHCGTFKLYSRFLPSIEAIQKYIY